MESGSFHGWTTITIRWCTASSRSWRNWLLLILLCLFLSLAESLLRVILKSFLTTEVTTILKHIPRTGMKGPEGAFTRTIRSPWDFNETVIEREWVSDRVLPTLLILSVEWEMVHNELVNFWQCEHLGVCTLKSKQIFFKRLFGEANNGKVVILSKPLYTHLCTL